MLKYKKDCPLFLYTEGKIHLYPSVYLYFYATALLDKSMHTCNITLV